MSPAIRGSTRVAGIIGEPIAHSRSPAIHNAAFAALGLDWVFVAFAVPAGAGFDAVRATAVLRLGGLNVTMPHKGDAVRACDDLTATAAAVGSVNTVTLHDGRLRGDSTDGEGFVRAAREAGFDPGGRICVVLGAGGAARAVVHALGVCGARVTVAARRPDSAAAVAALAPGATPVGFEHLDDVVAGADLVVNATPLGMGSETPPFDPEVLAPGQLVFDTVYHPEETPLLAAARARGATGVNGLGMLVHQAALAFEQWTGQAAPLAVMYEAGARRNTLR